MSVLMLQTYSPCMARFLVVDESAESLDSIQRSLRGHVVFCAMSDKQTLHLLQRHQIDLLLVAVHLENSDGFALLRSVKADDKLRALRVVFFCDKPAFIARYANDIVRAAGKALGAYRYVVMESPNPVRFKQLVEECLPDSCWQKSGWPAVYELQTAPEVDDHQA